MVFKWSSLVQVSSPRNLLPSRHITLQLVTHYHAAQTACKHEFRQTRNAPRVWLRMPTYGILLRFRSRDFRGVRFYAVLRRAILIWHQSITRVIRNLSFLIVFAVLWCLLRFTGVSRTHSRFPWEINDVIFVETKYALIILVILIYSLYTQYQNVM